MTEDERNNPLSPPLYFDICDRDAIEDGFALLAKKIEKRIKLLESRGDGCSDEAVALSRKLDRMESIRTEVFGDCSQTLGRIVVGSKMETTTLGLAFTGGASSFYRTMIKRSSRKRGKAPRLRSRLGRQKRSPIHPVADFVLGRDRTIHRTIIERWIIR